jgi:hypothetical protein
VMILMASMIDLSLISAINFSTSDFKLMASLIHPKASGKWERD